MYKKNKLKGTLLIVNLWIFSSTPWTCVYIVYIKLSDLSIIHIVLKWEHSNVLVLGRHSWSSVGGLDGDDGVTYENCPGME